MLRPLLTILLICSLALNVASQAIIHNSDSESIAKVVSGYYHALGEESPIFNGSEYLEYAYTIQDGHPYFVSSVWADGDIDFDGMTFKGVPMLYDIVKDQVIIQDFQKIHKINLMADKIDQFTLYGHTFVHILRDSLNGMKTGFYDRLYDGKVVLLARRGKKVIEKYSSLQLSNGVISQTAYYLRRGDVYHSVRNKNSMLDALKDRKKDLQQFLKKNKIKFRHDPEGSMILVVQYYDQLRN